MARSRGPELLVSGPPPWFTAEAQSRETGREPGVNSVCLQVSSAFLWPESSSRAPCARGREGRRQSADGGAAGIVELVFGRLRHTWHTRGWGPAEP